MVKSLIIRSRDIHNFLRRNRKSFRSSWTDKRATFSRKIDIRTLFVFLDRSARQITDKVPRVDLHNGGREFEIKCLG